MAIPNTHLHWYGKASKPKRKLGHITVRADSQDALQEYLLRLEMVLKTSSGSGLTYQNI